MLRCGKLSLAYEVDQISTSHLPKFYLQQEGFKCPQEQQYIPGKHKNPENIPYSGFVWKPFEGLWYVMLSYETLFWHPI